MDDINLYILENLDDSHNSISKLLYKLYKNMYCITTDNNKEKWFKYNGNYWQTSNGIKYEIKNKISNELAPLISNARTILRERIMRGADDLKTSWEKERLHKLLNIEKMLYNTHQKDSIIKECESLFYVENLL